MEAIIFNSKESSTCLIFENNLLGHLFLSRCIGSCYYRYSNFSLWDGKVLSRNSGQNSGFRLPSTEGAGSIHALELTRPKDPTNGVPRDKK